MKYIPTEKLIAKIERRKNESREIAQEHKDSSLGNAAQTMANEDEEILSIITSLQQEQPEVDLDKEFNDFLDNVEGMPRMWHSDEQIEWGKDIARHFAQWGATHSKK